MINKSINRTTAKQSTIHKHEVSETGNSYKLAQKYIHRAQNAQQTKHKSKWNIV